MNLCPSCGHPASWAHRCGWHEPQVFVDGAEGVRIPKDPEASREVSKALREMYPPEPTP